MTKRLFLLVLDGLGIGELPDAGRYNDRGCNTIATLFRHNPQLPNLQKLGLMHIDGVEFGPQPARPLASYCRLARMGAGKDSLAGHWELAGVIHDKLFPTFPGGFPVKQLDELSIRTFRNILCNRTCSDLQVLRDHGREHIKTGDLIVYTSGNSDMIIAAHEQVIALPRLYEICEEARRIMHGPFGVGRVIARPFTGGYPDYVPTFNRRDFSLLPPRPALPEVLQHRWIDVIGIGKVSDIYAGKGITQSIRTYSNEEGMDQLIHIAAQEFSGLCITNLSDFSALYGQRGDSAGFAQALSDFDCRLGEFLKKLYPHDILMITSDHGCDPAAPVPGHSREYAPLLIYGRDLKGGVNLGTRRSSADVAATIQDYFSLSIETAGKSFLQFV